MNPQAQPAPKKKLPERLLSMLTPIGQEWTSQTFQELFGARLAHNIHKIYQAGQSCYVSFCQHHDLSPLPVTESTLFLFMTFPATERVCILYYH